MKHRKLIIQSLRILWIVFLLYNEVVVFWRCAHNITLQLDKSDRNILLIADPQMTDDLSYNRIWIVMELTKFYSELYMKRNYKKITSLVRPNRVMIMGDLMDNGREWNDEIYSKEVERFNGIFSSKYKTEYMVGNHDVGFGDGIKPELLIRFQSYFGQTSYAIEDKQYTLLVLDTVSLSSHIPEIRKVPLNILENHNRNNTILFTHVPLYRKPNTACGPFRQSIYTQSLVNEYGYQYQNMLSKELSDSILSTVKPILVLSADDHDYCEVTHSDATHEITVPTFSMSQGVGHPGLMVLSLSDTHIKTHLFWLPSQINLFIRYGILFMLTILFIAVYEYRNNTAHILPMKSKEIQPRKTFSAYFIQSINDIAFLPLLTYIVCIMFL